MIGSVPFAVLVKMFSERYKNQNQDQRKEFFVGPDMYKGNFYG